jgi:hypothetical protein
MRPRNAITAAPHCTRRDFVRTCTLLSAAAVLPLNVRGQAAKRPVSLRVGLLTGASARADLGRGFLLGIDEASRAAELLRGTITAVPGRSVRTFAEGDCTVVVGGLEDSARAAAAQHEASRRGLLYLNAAASADSLRSPNCGALGFHVALSDALRRAAGAGAVAWHPRLTRFGAEQLNDRFRHRFASEMSEAAWFGWMAAKVAWEAAVRAGSVRGNDLASALARPGLGFDGHKGRALRFNALDGQLYYPLYTVPDLREVAPPVPPPAAHGRGACTR